MKMKMGDWWWSRCQKRDISDKMFLCRAYHIAHSDLHFMKKYSKENLLKEVSLLCTIMSGI